MWLKILITIILFYFFALLRDSFFLRFNIFGIAPNLIFIFFFLLIFFSGRDLAAQAGKPRLNWEDICLAVAAGLFLDISSYSYFGVSIVLLLITAVLVKKILHSLRERPERYPIIYFVSLFLIFNIVYDISSGIFLYFFDPAHIAFNFNLILLLQISCNLIVAVIGFYIAKILKAA